MLAVLLILPTSLVFGDVSQRRFLEGFASRLDGRGGVAFGGVAFGQRIVALADRLAVFRRFTDGPSWVCRVIPL